MESLNKSFSGDFEVALDEAGRVAVPRNLRNTLEKDAQVVLTRGADPCIWLYTVEEWNRRMETIVKNTDPDSAEGRDIRRRFIARAHYVDLDKQGRILIPPMLREYAGLTGECLVLGQYDYVEFWQKERFKEYECSQEEYNVRSEAFAHKKELKNAGNSAHSGTGGGDAQFARSAGER